MLWLLWILPKALGYDCIEGCDSIGRLVGPHQEDDTCLISMPDNPPRLNHQIRPCMLEIQSNCTDFCHVELNFVKFNLPKCSYNLTRNTDHCDHVEGCEYVMLHEVGYDIHGSPDRYTTHFDGHKTKHGYVSRTDRVLLKFCYRSETFSARNIQIEYRAIIPDSAKPLYLGPPSVYAMFTVVFLLTLGIAAIQWSPWLKPCLDPPTEFEVKRSTSNNV